MKNTNDYDKYIEYVILEISKSEHKNSNIFIEDVKKLEQNIREISKLSESISKILGTKIAIYSDWWKYLKD